MTTCGKGLASRYAVRSSATRASARPSIDCLSPIRHDTLLRIAIDYRTCSVVAVAGSLVVNAHVSTPGKIATHIPVGRTPPGESCSRYFRAHLQGDWRTGGRR